MKKGDVHIIEGIRYRVVSIHNKKVVLKRLPLPRDEQFAINNAETIKAINEAWQEFIKDKLNITYHDT